MVSRNFCQGCVTANFHNFHAVVPQHIVICNTAQHQSVHKFCFTKKIFREIYSLVKTLLSRSFCQKSERVNFRNFCIVSSACEIVLSRLLDENSVQSIFSLIYNDKSEIEFHETTELHTVM